MTVSLPDDEGIGVMIREAAQAFPPSRNTEEDIRHVLTAELERRSAAKRLRPKRRTAIAWAAAGTAAVCLIAALSLLLLSSSTTEPAYAELLRVVENSQTAEWTHMHGSFDGTAVELWYGLQPFRAFMITEDYIQGRDLTHQFMYEPETRTVTILALGEDDTPDLLRSSGSLYEYLLAEIGVSEEAGAKVTRSESVLEGRPCLVFSITGLRGRRTRIVVDDEAQRVVTIEEELEGRRAVLTADYPGAGPADMYEAGVPRDARIVRVDGPEILQRTE